MGVLVQPLADLLSVIARGWTPWPCPVSGLPSLRKPTYLPAMSAETGSTTMAIKVACIRLVQAAAVSADLLSPLRTQHARVLGSPLRLLQLRAAMAASDVPANHRNKNQDPTTRGKASSVTKKDAAHIATSPAPTPSAASCVLTAARASGPKVGLLEPHHTLGGLLVAEQGSTTESGPHGRV